MKPERVLAVVQGAVTLALFWLSSHPENLVWAPPASAHDLLALSRTGALFASGLYLGASAWAFARTRSLLAPATGLAVLAIPYLFNWLWILTSPSLVDALGRRLAFGAELAPWQIAWLGRSLVLAVFNATIFFGIGFVMDRRMTRGASLYALLLASAVFAAATPLIADAGAGRVAAILAALLAQAGLWAQTHLVTGALLGAIHGHRPTQRAALAHTREGLAKGAIFGGSFMALIEGLALARGAASGLRAAPLLGAALVGALLYPLARSILESFDGSAPFFRRLAASVREPVNLLRGLVVGAGLGFAALEGLPLANAYQRCGFGLLVGAAAYTGVDLLCDAAAIARGRRRRFQALRVYTLGAMLGGAIGGALGWYFEQSQLDVVVQKFSLYAAVAPPASGEAGRYVIYPLFSKWGAIDLGQVTGGVKLFFMESLSGVIGWSLAAPLFSFNLVLLTALLQRSAAPLRRLFTAEGLAGVGEQALRVQRWGLWMAPVIYSFLRLSPDPTWYDQDGAVRSVVAALHALLLDPGDFRHWSLEVFLGLLAYDWLRVLVWFDHMGLRVATLVNLSFIGGDLLDEGAARFMGHSARTRVIPEGLRRFATWAPLLIPFYIPRGVEWDQAWNGAELVRAADGALSAPVAAVLAGYGIAAGGSALALALVLLAQRRRGARPARVRNGIFTLGNGAYSLELSREGTGYSRILSAAHDGKELDLTRRPDDPLSLRGKLFYLRDTDPRLACGESVWSLGARPCGRASERYEVSQPRASMLRILNESDGVRAEARIEIDAADPVEVWRIRLENLRDHPRRLEITSYQELALDVSDAYRRHPRLSALYVGTRFVAPLRAILAQDRRPRGARGRPVRPIAFHAVGPGDAGAVRLTGYQDSRPAFVGRGTLRLPRALAEGRARGADDEGLLYTFDPCASLRVEVDLAARGSAQIVFVDGWSEDEDAAAALIARHLGIPLPDSAALAPGFTRARELDDSRRRDGTELPYEFSADGTELRIHADTPRPWAHLLANPLGHGALVNDDGAIFSFAGNAQKNGLTPFTLDTIPAVAPGQAVYVVPMEPDLAPIVLPQPRGELDVRFGRGYATFRQEHGELALELEICVIPDAPAELRLLRIENHGARSRRFRVAPYFEMMLAELPSDSLGKIEVRRAPDLGALFFTNRENDFHAGHAFVATSLASAASETVRARFVGGGGRDLSNPFFVEHGRPDESAPDDGIRIASFAGEIEVPAGGVGTVRILLGQTPSVEEAETVIRTQLPTAEQGAAATRRWWVERHGTLRIESNLPEFDRLVNDWLPYQVLTSRLWARSGPEQRSGAFGFRDQLQDVLPLLFHDPALARRQILLHAGKQFLEGDVLAWWHPSKGGLPGLGARGRASDVHLWLPYVVSRYVRATGDRALLDEPAPFLEGAAVPRGMDGMVLSPRVSRDTATVYEHCRRAIARTLAQRGAHGVPLLGSGDWNDALDRVGRAGRGESVWLGFFLHDALIAFADLAPAGPEVARADRAEAERLRTALASMWRTERYLRATTDAGEDLSFADALTAAWPVLSGAVDFERGRLAVESALEHLERDNLILLLAPPFEASSRPFPGRIADYPPGVRENGGQYSHGVSWLIDALVLLSQQAAAKGLGEEAARLRARAVEIWIKISPLAEMTADHLDRYGLPPHQQPADVYWGPGYTGRGGWSWYTGAAARMLSAAYALLGIQMRDGELVIPPDLFEPKGRLVLRRLVFRGCPCEPPQGARGDGSSAA
ncbi:MAG TPA: glycosyl transferase family 36 [Myxococcota bacterium]